MRIAITGSTGLVGEAVVDYFKEDNEIARLVRPKTSYRGNGSLIKYDSEGKDVDQKSLEGFDALIHLAGANIASKRWSEAYKETIRSSRVQSTKFLCERLAELNEPPRVLCCASAIGFYGNHGPQEIIDEAAVAGPDFLASVCEQWEESTQVLEAKTRIVFLRFGVVLSPKAGALGKMLLPFKLGLGGRLGPGTQMMSWIALEEIPLIIEHIINNNEIQGPVNCTAPEPVSNNDFTKILGRVIKRPTVFPVPAFGVNLLLGEMGKALLLGGAKVLPKALLDSGYTFKYPDLESALTSMV